MKFNHFYIVIILLLTIELYQVVCKPYTGSQIKKRAETKQVKSNAKNVKNNNTKVNAKNVQNNNTKAKAQTQTKVQAQPQAQSNQKKASSKQKNTNKTVTQGNPRITTVTSNTKQEVSNIPSTTTQKVDPVFDASITNRCAQYCSTIYDKCQYFNSPSLSEYTLENIYPPQNNSFGQCLCKDNHVSLYLECSLCLLATSGSPDLNSADQIIKSKCQAIEQTQSQISNNPIINNNNNNVDNNINNNLSDDGKKVSNMTPISLSDSSSNSNKKSFNSRNLFIVCSIIGGVLTIYGGYKLKEHIKDKRRKTLPPNY